MNPNATLIAWRAEFAAEAEQLEAELATALEEQREAEATYRRASDAWVGLRDSLTKPLASTEEMSAELYGRLEEERRSMLRDASGARARATGRVKALQGTLAGRRLALRQLDRALDPTRPTKIHEMVPRPKHSVIEFDTITPAREVNNGTR